MAAKVKWTKAERKGALDEIAQQAFGGLTEQQRQWAMSLPNDQFTEFVRTWDLDDRYRTVVPPGPQLWRQPGAGTGDAIALSSLGVTALVGRLSTVAARGGRLLWPQKGARLARIRRLGTATAATVGAGNVSSRLLTSPDRIAGQPNTGVGTQALIQQHNQGRDDPLANPNAANADVDQARAEAQMGDSWMREVMRDFGGQLAALGVGADDEPRVLVGWEFEGEPTGTGPGLARLSELSQRERLETVEEAIAHILQAPAAQLQRYQMMMHAAGFYDVDWDEVAWRFPGPETERAALRFMQWAANYRRDGRRVPWYEALDDIFDAVGGVAGPDAAEREPLQVELEDPVALGAYVDNAFRQIAGRKATSEEKRAFAATIHSLQREQARQAWELRGRGIAEDAVAGEIEGINVGARAQQFVEEQAPEDVMDVEVREALRGVGRALGS